MRIQQYLDKINNEIGFEEESFIIDGGSCVVFPDPGNGNVRLETKYGDTVLIPREEASALAKWLTDIYG